MDGSRYRERGEMGRFRTTVTPAMRRYIGKASALRRRISGKAIATRLGLTLYQVERIASEEANK